MVRFPKIFFVFLSLIVSFFVSSFIYTHYFLNSPEFNAQAFKDDVHGVVTSLTSFHLELPQITLFTEAISPTPPPSPETTGEPTEPDVTQPDEIPTSTPFIASPSIPDSTEPTDIIPNTTPIPHITNKPPQPTNKPKPTTAPDVFPIDPSLKRPGTTVDEIFTIAAQKACIPKAALRAFASIESGGFFDTVSPKYLLLYNSYNWWNSEFTADPKIQPDWQRICSGYGYDTNTGLIPGDSKYAGSKCKDGANSGLSVMGVTQVSAREYSLYGGDAARALGVSKTDRRVILDALIMTGMAVQREVHAGSCSNWSATELVKGACSYYGSCGMDDHTYYCATYCRKLKTFGGGDCSGAIKSNNCWQ